MHVDTNLDSLPFDVLQTITISLEALDLIHLRQVSRRLRDFTSERVLWTEKYRSSRLPRPPGPFTSHSLLDLEKILVRTVKVHQNMVVKAEPLAVREIDIGAEEDFRLLAGRWLISRSTDEVRCRDLDDPDFPRSSPTVSIHECSDDYNLSSLDCIEIIGHDGQSHAFIIVIEQHGLEEAWLIVLKLREFAQIDGLCDEVYRRHFDLFGSSSSVEAAIGPSSLLVKWENINNKLLIIGINDTPPISPLEVFDDTTEEDLGPDVDSLFESIYCFSNTHLLVIRPYKQKAEPMLRTRIDATPLTSVRNDGDLYATAACGYIDHPLMYACLFRDSVLDLVTGDTHIVLIGIYLDDPDRDIILAVRLQIPTTRVSSEIIIHTQQLASFNYACFMLQPSMNGYMRGICSTRRGSRESQVCAVAITYDEETESAELTTGADLTICHNDFVRRQGNLECTNNYLGRMCYTYLVSGRSWAYPRGRRMLSVVDFA